eukprot:12254270-Alexandrium_andersonii.AAC.1
MSASLVGSEMCIRDRSSAPPSPMRRPGALRVARWSLACPPGRRLPWTPPCLLYTSDAADDM